MRRSPALAAIFLVTLLAACGGGDDDPPAPPPPPPPPPPLTDPLADQQWFLDNRGQAAFAVVGGTPGVDLNLQSVHAAGVLGQGVPVLVIDSGIEPGHEDLAPNVRPSMLQSFDPRSLSASDPTPIVTSDDGEAHGTAVAGIIGAVRHNERGGASVAPESQLGGIRYLCSGEEVACQRSLNFVQAMGQAAFSRDAWVINGSFGSVHHAPVPLFDYDRDARIVAMEGLSNLREGKGAVFIKAAGNAFYWVPSEDGEPPAEVLCGPARAHGLSCHNAGTDEMSLPPNAIVVGAVNADGARSSYSSAGSVLLAAGLGGEFGLDTGFRPPPDRTYSPGPALITTDWSGCDRGVAQTLADGNYRNAFNDPSSTLARERNPGCRYTSTMNGTSSAAPTVSGVIALMLSVNPDLTWRDVREILVQTSRRDILVAPPEVRLALEDGNYVADGGWQRNAAGYWHSNWYGYGLVDAEAAVAAAKARPGGMLSGAMRDLGWLDVAYVWPDGAEPEDDDALPVPPGRVEGARLTVDVETSLTLESVQLVVALLGSGPLGEVGIELVSPAGTRSVVLNPYTLWADGEASLASTGITLASQAFFGEDAKGTWEVRVVDVNARGADEPEVAVDTARLRLRGR